MLREEHVPRVTRLMRAAIGEQVDAAVEAVGTATPVSDAIDSRGEALRDAYRQAWLPVYTLFAGRTFDAIRGEVKQNKDDHIDKWQQLVDEFLETHGATRIVAVGQTTKDFVQSIVRQSIEDGLGIPETRRAIREAWESVSNTRAERIARTEVVGAANAGSLQGAKDIAADVGLDLRKRWLATLDGRQRDSHELEHMQEAPLLDEPFTVRRPGGGNDMMQHPGDPAGSAANVINCRCTVIYDVL